MSWPVHFFFCTAFISDLSFLRVFCTGQQQLTDMSVFAFKQMFISGPRKSKFDKEGATQPIYSFIFRLFPCMFVP